ncbi:unnamed protein product, partial [Schistosoma turkestanicum]
MMSQSSISPEEWFICAQSSILSCLLERPTKQTDSIDDPDEIFDSDDSEPCSTNDYYTYRSALLKQQHRINRLQRFIKHCFALKQRETTVKHRVKNSLHFRLTGQFINHNNDGDDDQDDDNNHDNDYNSDDNTEDHVIDEQLNVNNIDYDPHRLNHLHDDCKNSIINERKINSSELLSSKKLNLSNLQPQWILRRLHLNPDFMDTWWSSQLELEFYEALNIIHTKSDKRHTTHTNLKDYIEFHSTVVGNNNVGDDVDEDQDEEDEEEEDGEDDYNLTIDALGNRKLAFFEKDRQWTYSDSYAWRLIRLGLMQLAKRELNRLIQIIDFNGEDLAVHAPGLMTLTRLVDRWLTGYRSELTSPPALYPVQLKSQHKEFINEHLLPPTDFLPDIQDDLSSSSITQMTTGIKTGSNLGTGAEVSKSDLPTPCATRSMLRLKKLINFKNTPFQTRNPFSLPVKRLWCYLVRQPEVDDIFLRHIFRKPYLIQSIMTPNIQLTLTSSTSLTPSTVTFTSSEYNNNASGLIKSTSSSNLKNISTVTMTDAQKSSGKQTRTQQQQQQTQSTQQSVSGSLLFTDAVRLIHKEHDPLIAMCINQ